MLRLNTPKPRIISFAPSITETIYALGAQEHLVGVTDFCTYPPEAVQLPRVGGYINPNYEQILSLKPDITILLKEHGSLIAFLEQHKIGVVKIDNENLAGIFSSISRIGAACGLKERGDSLAAGIESAMKMTTVSLSRKPKILFCVGRDKPGSGTIGKVFLAGPRTFYSELIMRLGGENAVSDSVFAYPSVAGEGIIHLVPDIIIDVMASNKLMDPSKVSADWNELGMLPAVKLGAVYAITGNYISIPGPRIVKIFNDLHRCINDWNVRITLGSACLRFK
ncbi:MAG: ABC transporter substrate-binding protein [Chitinispirillaceae bacterium]|nr:ABC transporter substrate-binding protein [Chitinispirillaceae bacterium]